jgi:hypothetical protein
MYRQPFSCQDRTDLQLEGTKSAWSDNVANVGEELHHKLSIYLGRSSRTVGLITLDRSLEVPAPSKASLRSGAFLLIRTDPPGERA